MITKNASTVCTAKDVSIIHKTIESDIISEALAINFGCFVR